MTKTLVGLIPGPLKKFAGALGLGSPSRIFRGFGQDTMQGFVLGLQDMEKQVSSAMGVALPSVGDTTFAGALAAARSGSAVNVENAYFSDKVDVEGFMRQAAWVAQTQRI